MRFLHLPVPAHSSRPSPGLFASPRIGPCIATDSTDAPRATKRLYRSCSGSALGAEHRSVEPWFPREEPVLIAATATSVVPPCGTGEAWTFPLRPGLRGIRLLRPHADPGLPDANRGLTALLAVNLSIPASAGPPPDPPDNGSISVHLLVLVRHFLPVCYNPDSGWSVVLPSELLPRKFWRTERPLDPRAGRIAASLR
jgi:hypothetical protein